MILPIYQADLARKLNITRGAVADRLRRGTLPPFDGVDSNGRGYWTPETIKHLETKKAPNL
jgi:hypothetical protein